MKQAVAFFRLIRWQNLVFIAMTQCLFYCFIIFPELSKTSYFYQTGAFSISLMLWLVLASMMIAAAGYIINDYFDINIDEVNKPEKMVVQKFISRRHAILLHLTFTFIGLLITGFVAWRTSIFIFIGNVICAILLWAYSTNFKRRLLSGNVMIAALTAWTILVLYISLNGYSDHFQNDFIIRQTMQKILRYVLIYAGFAFIVSLIREVVKDMEDVEGDRRYQCNTMPIAWGIHTSKVFTGVWIVVLFSAIIIIQLYVLQKGWWVSVLYCGAFILTPMMVFSKKLFIAKDKEQFAEISKWIKVVMLTGILSLVVIGYHLSQ